MTTWLKPHASSSSPRRSKLGGMYPPEPGEDWDPWQSPGSSQGFYNPEGLGKTPSPGLEAMASL